MEDTSLKKQIINILDQYFEGVFNNEISSIPLAEDVTFNSPLSGHISGKEKVLEFLADVAASFSNAQYHVDKDIIDGNDAFSLVQVRLSQGEILNMAHVFGIDKGSIRSINVIFDPRVILS